MQVTQKIQKKQVTLEDIYNEVKSMREEMRAKLDLIRFKMDDILLPVEEISDDEREELDKIEEEMKRGEKFRLEDVMAELGVS